MLNQLNILCTFLVFIVILFSWFSYLTLYISNILYNCSTVDILALIILHVKLLLQKLSCFFLPYQTAMLIILKKSFRKSNYNFVKVNIE